MTKELTNGRLFKWLSAEMFVGGVIGVFVAGMLWMGVQSSVAMAQTTAEAAMAMAITAEEHSKDRAKADAKEMKAMSGEISEVQAELRAVNATLGHIVKQQDRILQGQENHQDRHNGDN
jgi:hypothetical protein